MNFLEYLNGYDLIDYCISEHYENKIYKFLQQSYQHKQCKYFFLDEHQTKAFI